MTDGRGLAFLNKIQALHCEGLHCQGSSAFVCSRSRWAARWGKVLGQADHNLPSWDHGAEAHHCKLDRLWKTWPGRAHEHRCHPSPPHSHSPLNSVMLSSDQAAQWDQKKIRVWSMALPLEYNFQG